MLAVAGIGLGLLLGLLCGGRLGNLRLVQFRGESGALALFVVQALARGPALAWLGDFGLVLWATCSAALLFLIVMNRRLVGMAVAATGIAANLLVILVNKAMPVMPGGGVSLSEAAEVVGASHGFYALADARTQLLVLGDVLPTPYGLASVGDVLLVVGIATFLVAGMVQAPASEL